MPTENMLSFPSPGSTVRYRDWRISDTEYLLLGAVERTETGYLARIELYNLVSEQLVLSKLVTGGPANEREVAHRISDLVYEEITGIAGIFGTRILYVTDTLDSSGTRLYRLMLADQDGAREQMVMESPEPIMSPAWSPDGENIAYVSFETGRAAIFQQNLATGERQQLTDYTGINGAPAWSPDGSKLAVVLSKDGNPEIYSLDLASKQLTRLTNHYAIDTEPNWTPDGKFLVFTSDRGGRPQIYRLNLETKIVSRLTFEGDYNARPRLSPDGRHLVMVHRNQGIYKIAVQDMVDGDC